VLVNGQRKHVVSYMKISSSQAEQARTAARQALGRRARRLMLAQTLAKSSNLLVLDEPTNDLDMRNARRARDMLADYPGTVLLITTIAISSIVSSTV